MKCRDCTHLYVLGTGSQIILVCTVTKEFVDYEKEACEHFERKNLDWYLREVLGVKVGGVGEHASPTHNQPRRRSDR